MLPSANALLSSLVSQLWAGTLLGLLVVMVLVGVPRIQPRLRRIALWIPLLRCLLPLPWLPGFPSLSERLAHFSLAHLNTVSALFRLPAFIVGGGASAPIDAKASTLPSIAFLILSLWLAGAVCCLLWSLRRWKTGLRALHHRHKPLPAHEQQRLHRLCTRTGVDGRRVRASLITGGEAWLGVIGLFRSRILIPEDLYLSLDEPEKDSLLLHELMHVRRRDNLQRLLLAIIENLLWFHPLVWWLARRLRWESECACDAGVLSHGGSADAYAQGLFKATRHALSLDLPGVSGMSRLGLPQRLQVILQPSSHKDSAMLRSTLLVLLLSAASLATLSADTAPGNPGAELCDVSALDNKPEPIKNLSVTYPDSQRKPTVKGSVEVLVGFTLDTDGKVMEAHAARSSNADFNESALTAVRQWAFKPCTHKGKPVRVKLEVPIVFSIQPKPTE